YNDHKCVFFNRKLREAVAHYRTADLFQGLDSSHVRQVVKSDVLLGLREFLRSGFLDTVSSHSTRTDPQQQVLDGTNRFCGQLMTIYEMKPIVDFVLSLDGKGGNVILDYKKPDALLAKIFIRGKTLDDMCRGSFVADDFGPFF